jgi:uncharacterized protein YjiS (DUF1127 family)
MRTKAKRESFQRSLGHPARRSAKIACLQVQHIGQLPIPLHPPALVIAPRVTSYWIALRKLAVRWWRNFVSRRELLSLDDRALGDLSLSRVDALAEGLKPFWRQ